MAELRFAPGAVRDLQRLREFLQAKSPVAAKRAGETIVQSLQVLRRQPQLGRPIEDLPERFREWVIDFGTDGYVARYRVEGGQVVVLAIRHQKEAGYS
jgi:plasmid stabilization system protein ParE